MLRAMLVIAVAGCASAPHVPDRLRGPESMSIANEMRSPLCTFAMTTDTPSGENWLGDTIVRPFERVNFRLAPGRYHVEATTCGTHERASGFIDVRDTIVVAIGNWREPAPAYLRTSVVPAVAP
jgi:hypothetical protein